MDFKIFMMIFMFLVITVYMVIKKDRDLYIKISYKEIIFKIGHKK